MPLIAAADPEESAWYGRRLRRLLVAHLDMTLARDVDAPWPSGPRDPTMER